MGLDGVHGNVKQLLQKSDSGWYIFCVAKAVVAQDDAQLDEWLDTFFFPACDLA
jgi:hypothetical protein